MTERRPTEDGKSTWGPNHLTPPMRPWADVMYELGFARAREAFEVKH